MDQKVKEYIAEAGLRAAVEVALDLELPLLVTGEPGTGKTQLAYWVADKVLGDSEVLRFNTKTTSVAKDLFYRYDAIRHFRDAQLQGPGGAHVNPLDYVHLEALGLAILGSPHRRYVVLVDEIDKAPRDFPNDILFEFEELAFRIEEANDQDLRGYDFSRHPEVQRLKWPSLIAQPDAQGFIRHAADRPRPVLILTSNSEKNLPDAFLRRCVFYHIPFPSKETLAEIVRKNVDLSDNYKAALNEIIDRFLQIREQGLRKKPATAELNQWVRILQRRGIDGAQLAAEELKELLQATYPVLAKNREDLEKLRQL